MRRKIIMILLGIGAVGGFASGFAHLHHLRAHCEAYHRAALDEACSHRADPPAEPAR